MRDLPHQLARKSQAGRALGVANDLKRLAALYGGSDKLEHGYLPYYEQHFGPMRHRKLRVWEIGVGGYHADWPSGSLRIWRDYFYRSQILGLDIEDKFFNFGKRVQFERVDQSSTVDLQRAVDHHGVPDVVIDDGSHLGPHIKASFEFLWPQMPSGSVYAVEDLSTSYYPDWGGGNPAPSASGVGFVQVLADCVQELDPTFAQHPELGLREPAAYTDVAAVHVYPGLAFAHKH
jgi:hypothetical protein